MLPRKYTRRLLVMVMVDGNVIHSYVNMRPSQLLWHVHDLERHGYRKTDGTVLTPEQFEIVIRWEDGKPHSTEVKALSMREEWISKHLKGLWSKGVKFEGFVHDEILLSIPDASIAEASVVLAAIYSQRPPAKEEPKPEEKPPVELNKEFWDAYTGMDTKDIFKDNLRQNAKTFSFSTGIETGRTSSSKPNPSNPLRQGQDEKE